MCAVYARPTDERTPEHSKADMRDATSVDLPGPAPTIDDAAFAAAVEERVQAIIDARLAALRGAYANDAFSRYVAVHCLPTRRPQRLAHPVKSVPRLWSACRAYRPRARRRVRRSAVGAARPRSEDPEPLAAAGRAR